MQIYWLINAALELIDWIVAIVQLCSCTMQYSASSTQCPEFIPAIPEALYCSAAHNRLR